MKTLFYPNVLNERRINVFRTGPRVLNGMMIVISGYTCFRQDG